MRGVFDYRAQGSDREWKESSAYANVYRERAALRICRSQFGCSQHHYGLFAGGLLIDNSSAVKSNLERVSLR